MARTSAAEFLIDLLGLKPLPNEGGFYAETWSGEALQAASGADHRIGSAIYYLITPTDFSAMHRLPTDEVFHFYAGDPVEQLLLHADGTGSIQTLGIDFAAHQRPQIIAPGGVWQGSRLAPGFTSGFALIGTTMAPGFRFQDYEHGHRDELCRLYPEWIEAIHGLTRES